MVNLTRRQCDPLRWGLFFRALLKARGVKRESGRPKADDNCATIAQLSDELGVPLRTAMHRLKMADDFDALPAATQKKIENGEETLAEAIREKKREKLKADLEELAEKLDRSKNYIINQAVKEYVVRQSMEDARWKDTLIALNSIKSGKTVDEKEVTSWLESWGRKDEKTPPSV